jgi:hypothetical protein
LGRRRDQAFTGFTAQRADGRERICFINAGGIFGLFPKGRELDPLL